MRNRLGNHFKCQASRSNSFFSSSGCRTIGFLSLALELLCRNTLAYIEANKLARLAVDPIYSEQPMRSTRRTNAWQSSAAEISYSEQPMRTTRRMNAWQQAQADQGWD
jgi:hypothetical protein